MKLYKALFIVFCFSILTSCFSNRTFNKCTERNTSFYLCYIINEPIVVDIIKFSALSEQDKNILNSYKYKFELSNNLKENIKQYLLVKLKVQIVDYYMTQHYYDGFIRIQSALGFTDTVYLDSYFDYFKYVYVLIDKKDHKTLRLLKQNFNNKAITIFEKAHIRTDSDLGSILLSFEVYDLNNRTNFENLIRVDSIVIPENR